MSIANQFPFADGKETFLDPLFSVSPLETFLKESGFNPNEVSRLIAKQKCGLPLYLSCDKGKSKNNKKLRLSSRQQLQQFSKWLRSHSWTDEQRKYALHIVSSHLIKVLSKTAEGEWRIFDGRMKGTQAYNKYYKARIIDRATKYLKEGAEILALTITCDPKDYDGDRVAAWEIYNAKAGRLKKELQRKYHGGYIQVLESTADGWPHAHIILALPKGSVQGYAKMRNKTKIRYGRIIDLINKFKPARIFCLEKISGKNTMHYLTKYIAKYETNNFFDLANKKDELDKSERKAVDCLLYTILVGARQFTLSQERHETGLQKEKGLFDEPPAKATETSDEPATDPRSGTAAGFAPAHTTALDCEDFSAQRYYLIKRCINLPDKCKNDVFTMGFAAFSKRFGNLPDREIEKRYENIKTFQRKGCKNNCGGCIYRHILNFIKGGDDYLINFSFWDIDGERKRWFDDCDFTDDESFMRHFKTAIQSIFKWLAINKLTFNDFERASIECGVVFMRSDLILQNWRTTVLQNRNESRKAAAPIVRKTEEQMRIAHEIWKEQVNKTWEKEHGDRELPGWYKIAEKKIDTEDYAAEVVEKLLNNA